MDERLTDARKRIGEIDEKMARLFEERMDAVRQVAAYKKDHGLPILDAEREKENLEKGAKRISSDALRGYYVRFLQNTMEIAKDFQRETLQGMRVAYSGIPGAYAYSAAKKLFPDSETVPCANFTDAYRAVEKGECDVCVLPVENSSAGEVGQVSDLLFSGSLFICGSCEIPVLHVLCGPDGAQETSVHTVVSHAQALGQCAPYIEKRGLQTLEYENTALAARYVAELKDPSVAALCSEDSALLYGLTVLSRDVTAVRSNTTRFLALSRSENTAASARHGAHFVLMFTVRNEAGSLVRALSVIGAHGYNMRVLRSRPMKELLWQYYFYVELEGDVHNAEGAAMLEELGVCCDKLKMCGSYLPHFA